MASNSYVILERNAARFKRMLSHRFIEDIKKDILPREVFDRYLVFEGDFVETAVSIFAFLTAKAPDIARQRKLVHVLDALVNGQVSFFEDAYIERKIDPAHFRGSNDLVEPFQKGMFQIARDGTYLEGITAMFGAEWMYWTWNTDAAQYTISDDFVRNWVHLHTTDDFKAQALWLRDQIDAADLSREELENLCEIFGRVQDLEYDFHSAAYGAVSA